MRWVVAACLLALAAPARADDPPPRPTPFDQGKFSLGGGASSQSAFDNNYIVVGLGGGYFVLPGVELGLAAEHYFGPSPTISIVTPSLRYIAQPLVWKFPLIPYVGVFYSHYFISDAAIGDENGVGGRAGVIYISGRLLIGLGVGVERIVSTCTQDCTIVYPDISFGIGF
jgi:hypothetical protein